MPNITTIEGGVKRVLSRHFDKPEGDIASTLSLQADLLADELDIVELTMDLEDEFGVEITDDDAHAWMTVQDVLDCIAKKREGE